MHACRRIGSEKLLIGEEITGSFDKIFRGAYCFLFEM
jgi:hypothetical protein